MGQSFERYFFYAIVAAILLFLLLALFNVALVTIYQKRKHQHFKQLLTIKEQYERILLQTQIEVQEATFASLGIELHDNIGQLISSAKWLVSAGRQNADNLPELLEMVDDTLGKAVDEIRSLSKSLNKEWLAKFNLIENLQTEVRRISTATAIAIQLSHPPAIDLTADEQIILFRIIQEALQNAIKHATPRHIEIIVRTQNELVDVFVKDDGRGFSENELQTNGQGFMNMRKRTELLGGIIEWNTKTGNGCTVEIKIPLKPSA